MATGAQIAVSLYLAALAACLLVARRRGRD